MAQSTIVDDLRPLYANSDDIRDGKELADSTCAKCHGADGVSPTNSVPNLAGQRPSYVYGELNAYQRGDRTGGGGALREVPRRERRQPQGRRAKFDRSSSKISRGDDAVL